MLEHLTITLSHLLLVWYVVYIPRNSSAISSCITGNDAASQLLAGVDTLHVNITATYTAPPPEAPLAGAVGDTHENVRITSTLGCGYRVEFLFVGS